MSFLREVESFKTGKLKSVNTTVTTAEGRKFLERKSGNGSIITVDTGEHGLGFCKDLSPDDKVYNVLDNLFISSQEGARNLEELKQNNITHILNVGTGIENAFPKEFEYKTVEMLDLPETPICQYFPGMFDFIINGSKSGAVLVHCNAGVSRSVTVILGYLMFSKRLPLEEAMEIVKKARPSAKPNEGFLHQLQDYQTRLDLS
ncbi:dual specificity protein phosphatase 19-like [Stylophora pistillata]|uniref:Dual specificity protein phosphatase 19 n=1 Tax=Stylophora pistillata TaxID=50429 RepID=A0A2B4SG36_STYPI|nr:dual specificity protein phosphatase 19-like [Stylophora pistillata]PFX28841.1 Dual specificity protein phosphatase 19 [Stylophora pistillata]